MEATTRQKIQIPLKNIRLEGHLVLPHNPAGMVLFAHGTGSSHMSGRNNYVADYLYQNNIGSLLFDLLTQDEDCNYANRFNIPLLAERMEWATEWLKEEIPEFTENLAYFGASTGAAAALIASVQKSEVKAIVSRGGRPDLAMEYLPEVTAATQFIVGSYDYNVIDLNEKAYNKLECKKDFQIVKGATHLFEEPGKLEEVSALARDWFLENF